MGGILVDIHTASPLAGPLRGGRMFQCRHSWRQPARVPIRWPNCRCSAGSPASRRRHSRRPPDRSKRRPQAEAVGGEGAGAADPERRRASATRRCAPRWPPAWRKAAASTGSVRKCSETCDTLAELKQRYGRRHAGGQIACLEHRLDHRDRTRLPARCRRGDGALGFGARRIARRAPAARRVRAARRRAFPAPQPGALSRRTVRPRSLTGR